jgi:ABC-2 type transport system permease protein
MKNLFNKAVFTQSVKSNWVLFATVTTVMTLLLVQFSAIEQLSALLPIIFHGLMYLIVPSVYVLITANKLLCSQVDSGSLAYILATKVKRQSIAFTQIVFLVGSLFILFFVLAGVNLLTNLIVRVYSAEQIISINFSAFCAISAMAGICYMFSCIFNLVKTNMGVTGMLTLVFILASMLSLFSTMAMDALKVFKYITIFSLYDPASIVAGTLNWIIGFSVLLAIAIATFITGLTVFKKKDLPL